MAVLLENQLVAVQRGVELRELAQRRHAGLDQKGQHGDLDTRLLVLRVGRDPERFKVGDVRLIMVGDVGNHDPVSVQVGGADLLDARQVFALDGTELAEVHLRPGDQSQPRTVRAGTCTGGFGLRGGSLCLSRASHYGAREGLHIGFGNPAFETAARDLAQGHPEFAREFAHRRRRMRQVAPQRASRVMRGQR